MEAETGGRRAGAKLRRTLWVLCGLLPFAAGRLYNQVLLEGEGLAAPALPAWTGFFARHMGLTALLVLLLWGLLGFLLCRSWREAGICMVFSHIPAALCLLCNILQDLGGHYWSTATQLFFLPILWLAYRLEGWFVDWSPLVTQTAGRMWFTYLICFALMAGAFAVGMFLRTVGREPTEKSA